MTPADLERVRSLVRTHYVEKYLLIGPVLCVCGAWAMSMDRHVAHIVAVLAAQEEGTE